MEKIGKWSFLSCVALVFFPIAAGCFGAFYFATDVDSLKMRRYAEAISGEPAKFTQAEKTKLLLSRILPVPLVIIGLVAEWYWGKTLLAFIN